MLANRNVVWMVCVLGTLAVAQEPQPTLAPFPLELRRTPSGFSKKDGEELRAEFRRLVRSAGAMVPNAGTMETALLELKRQDCDRENDCLQQLAQKAQTLYGLHASIDYDLAKNVVATGRVVRDDGKLVGEQKTIQIPKGKDAFPSVARVALVQLLEALKVRELKPFREVPPVAVTEPVVTPDAGVPPPLPPPFVTEPAYAETSLRAPGVGLLVGGAAVAIAGAIVAGVAQTNLNSGGLIQRPNNQTDQQAVDAYRGAKSQQVVGQVLIGVGAAAAIAGVILIAIPPKRVAITALPIQGGAFVSAGGTF